MRGNKAAALFRKMLIDHLDMADEWQIPRGLAAERLALLVPTRGIQGLISWLDLARKDDNDLSFVDSLMVAWPRNGRDIELVTGLKAEDWFHLLRSNTTY